MSIDSAIPVVWDVLKCVVTPIKRQFGYVMSSKSYALDLNKEVRNLENEAERVHVVAEVARNNLRIFYGEFTEWEASAEKALKEAQDLLGNFEKDSKTCCYGTFPDPKCRYQFSRKAKGKMEVIKQLTQKCNGFKVLNDISFSDPAPGNVAAPNLARKEGKDVVQRPTVTASTSFASTSIKLREDSVFESRASIIRDIMAALADNSKSVVGVYGMGGVGKSTLLADVERRIREDKSFNLVAKAEVSENPDIKRIQGEIAHALGLDIKNEEYVNVRADLLRSRLENEEKMKHANDEERKKKKVLIILDNLWEALDLKSVGIPCGHDNKVRGCKLLLTSRNREVLQTEMGCDDPFHLGELQEEEARRLFERYVGDKVHDFEFKPLVDEALHKCAGSPFLIVQMAKLLKHANLSGWKNVLKQLKLSKNEGIGEKINKMLQLSYDHLKGEDVKLLLRLCVICGVSKPSVENLVRYGVGLGLFREDNMEEARDSLTSLISTLQASSLLLEDGDAYSIKIHDLVREFVASVASRDHPMLVLKDKDKLVTEWSKDKLKTCRAICFPNIDMKKLPEELDCPELQIFLLFTNNESLIVPNSYFNSMRKLAVLNLKGIRLTHSPLSFRLLESLHTLCLDGCLLEDVASLGNLKWLQILSFVNSKVHRLPKEIGQLAELRLLDLNHCSQLRVIEPGVLGSLIKLEELYMENSFDEWNVVGKTPPTNANLIELNNMKNLHTLHVSIPDPSALPEDLNVEKLIKYRIQIGNMRQWSSEYKGLKALNLKLNTMNDILHKGCVRTTLDRSDDLYLDGLNGIEQSFSELSLEGFPTLKHLQIENNSSVHYILGWHSPTTFKMLESLHLRNLINLEKICHSISSKPFSTLKVVRVVECHKMEVLFPLSLLRELPQLEEIGVVNCNLMREIVGADDCGKVELCNLHVLELRDLPSIKNFFTPKTAPSSSTSNIQVGSQAIFFNGQQVSMPSLESLIMSGLPNLKDIWSDESPLGVSNLQSLEVLGCKSLSKVIDFLSLVKLQKLQTLSIKECISVQEIFDLVGPSTGGNVETLSELTNLNLWDLSSLRCIWNKNPCGIVRFHNLKKLDVLCCDKLKFLFLPSMVQSLPQLGALEVRICEKMETIIMEEEGQGMETSKTLVFPMLTNISFSYMNSLTCFSHEKCSQEAWSQDHVKSSSIALFNQEVAFPSLETLEIIGMDNIEMIWDNQVAVDYLPNLKSLDVKACNKLKCIWNKELHCQVKFRCLRFVSISRCQSLTSLFPASVARNLMQLEELKIDRCRIVELIEKEGLIPKVVFPRLTFLKLKHLTELKCIYRTHALHWPVLKTLEVHGCKKVKILASQLENEMPLHKQPLFTVEKGAFPNLQELKLDLSEQMEIWHGHCHNEEFFSKLKVLEFHHLSKETTISTCHFVKSLTNLEKLVVCESNLEALSINVIEDPSHELEVILPFSTYFQHLEALSVSDCDGLSLKLVLTFSRYFQHLKTLDVSHCVGLSNMFTPTIAANLVELTKLRISNCKMLTEVICDERGKEGHVVAFNQLKCMELDGLTRLRCFSSCGYTLVFPLLEDVIVKRCPNMKFFSEGPIEMPKLERVHISTTAWFWKENLNITIRNMFEEMATVAGEEFMRLSEFPEIIGKWHNELNPIKSSWQLKSLMVDKCPSFINVIPSKLMLVLDNMRSLQVWDCELLEEIFNLEGLEGVESTRVLPRLEDLNLVNLPKLRRLWNKDLQEMLCFKSLSVLILYNCSNLGHAFAPSMTQCLASLEHMEINECGKMEGVITEEEGQGSKMEKITFPKLRWIKLKHLPNLTCFLSAKDHMMDCPNLKYLTIAHCPKMISLTLQSTMEIGLGTPSFFTPQVQFPCLQWMVLSHMDSLSKIWIFSPQETLTFKHLRTVKAKNCKNLENLFPHWVATSLTQLEKLQVESCRLQEIVTSGDDTPHFTTIQFLFPKLTSLVLHDMPQLKSLCSITLTSNWPFLMELRVTHCDKLNMLSFVASKNKGAQRDKQRDLSDPRAHFSIERGIPTLERLLLVNKDIQTIHNRKFCDDFFGKPKALTLACFHDEIAAFPPIFLLQRFRNLQSLEVFCSSFEDIFPDEGVVDEGKHPMLENLKELKLSKLHNLKHVWREGYLVAKILQSIGKFEVWDCPSLTTIFPVTTSFRNLTNLVVKNSSGLVQLVTVSAVTNLVHLTDMTIIGCERMKEVVTDDANREGKVISFEKLSILRLKHLRNLECFSSTPHCIFRFPSLIFIRVEECPKMKIFSKGMPSTPKLRYASLFGYEWNRNWEDDLNTTIQKSLA